MRVSAAHPNGRASKRQVVVFLPMEMDTTARRVAAGKGMTLQEILAVAINAEIERRGGRARLSTRRLRPFQRLRNPAAPRREEGNPVSRAGRKGLSGWFERNEVKDVHGFCAEIGSNVQEIARQGFEHYLDGITLDDPPSAA